MVVTFVKDPKALR